MIENGLWRRQVGLLPVNFLHRQDDNQQIYAMLNGSAHNFCVGYDYDLNSASIRDKVWSANMTSYMSITDNTVRLYDIYRTDCEEINTSVIERDLYRFYAYLSTKSLKREDGVLELVLNHFKYVRSMLREKSDARLSLSVLLQILSRLDGTEGMEWQLPDVTRDAIARLSVGQVDNMTRQLKEGLGRLSVRPNTDMILRHCSGALFQEANFIAHFPLQLSLFPTTNFSLERNPNLVGAYFTPSFIARTIVEESLKHIDIQHKDNLIIFDPACGSGVFLSECLRQLRTRKYRGHVHVIGWDIDSIAIDMSNFVLSFEKQEWGDDLTYNIQNNNSLNSNNPWPKCDLILMNPPYISWAMMNEEQRRYTTEIFGSIEYRPNLSVVFYYLASQALKESGVIGSLMPSSFLRSERISDIRKYVNDHVPPVLIGQLGNYIFTSAFVDVSIVIAQKGFQDNRTQFLWTRNDDKVSEEALRALRRSNANSRIEYTDDYNIYFGDTRELIEKDMWRPLSQDSVDLHNRLSMNLNRGWLATVETLFDVKQGARTGANKIFILSKKEYESLPRKERIYFRPSIDNDAINDGRLECINYIFYPHPEDENGFVSEGDLSEKMPEYYQKWLKPNKDLLQKRSKINVDKWWQLSWPRTWQFEKKTKLVSTEFGRAGSFSVDEEGTGVVERGLCWIPKGEELSMDEMCFYLAILNSIYFNRLLLIYSKQLTGDIYNLETKHVNPIPLPVYNAMPKELQEVLSQYGRYMLRGKDFNSNQLYELVRRTYGM